MRKPVPIRQDVDLAAVSAALHRAESQLSALRSSIDSATVRDLEARIAQAHRNLDLLMNGGTLTGFGAAGPFWRNMPGIRFDTDPSRDAPA